MSAIVINAVWKKFTWHQNRARTLKDMVLAGGRFHGGEPFWALQDVSFTVERGETFGIVGSNGSGKSTLLKLITGISKPSKGKLHVDGKVSALLELGAGFHPDFTGRENVYLNGSILGLSRKQIDACFDEIVAFADIGNFIDQPVKTYSSGMYMRLAFSIAVNVDPDILVVDEVLAVGDTAFQEKCFQQIERFKRQGKTILIVSHDLGSLKRFCSRVAWISKGVLKEVGETDRVIDLFYQDLIGLGAVDVPREAAPRPRPVLISGFAFEPENPSGDFPLGGALNASFDYQVIEEAPDLELVVKLLDTSGRMMVLSPATRLDHAQGRLDFGVQALNLPPGGYLFEVESRRGSERWPIYQAPITVAAAAGEGLIALDCAWNRGSALLR